MRKPVLYLCEEQKPKHRFSRIRARLALHFLDGQLKMFLYPTVKHCAYFLRNSLKIMKADPWLIQGPLCIYFFFFVVYATTHVVAFLITFSTVLTIKNCLLLKKIRICLFVFVFVVYLFIFFLLLVVCCCFEGVFSPFCIFVSIFQYQIKSHTGRTK